MFKTMTRGGLVAGLVFAIAVTLGLPARADAQYFGRNKVQYDKFKFQILTTEHFDIYYYPQEADAAKQAARMAERWYARLSKLLGTTLTGRQPVILYASHPDFEQTNIIEGQLGEGTGGVTEGAKRRVIMPMAASLADTDHVLGHELVHAFQYDILGPNAEGLPLWFIEGMAEYFSLGGRDAQTAMWLRDAAIEDRLPDLKALDDPRFFPYRFGHAFWAYIGGRYGDATISKILLDFAPVGEASSGMGFTAKADAIGAIEAAVGMSADELAAAWHASVRETYGVAPRTRDTKERVTEAPRTEGGPLVIGRKTGAGEMNVGPALSPDGTRIAFLSERDQLSIDLYLADTSTGRIIRKLVETASDPHFESLQFLASAGTWDPQGHRLAIGAIRGGKPVIAIIDGNNGDVKQEIKFADLGEIFQPSWSPDGKSIAFSAQTGGYTDLFVHDISAGTTKRLTTDAYADLQPAWSPDGSRLAFVTDRFSTDLSKLAYGPMRIAQVVVSTGAIAAIDTGLAGSAVNPQWSSDGRGLFFISDTGGRTNAWRLDLETKQSTAVTSEVTGVAGITPSSPALSVATKAPKAAVSVFRGGGHEIQIIDTATAAPAPTTPVATTAVADAAILPPGKRTAGPVAEQLAQPAVGLPEKTEFPVKDYSPKLELVGVGQQVGVSTGGLFGTYVSGGIAFQFSDMLGEHLLGTSFGVNGNLKDISTGVNYLNRRSRWNWGVYGERVPLLSGTVRSGFVNSGGQQVFVEQSELFRQTYNQGGVVVAYPLSRVTRVEFGASARHISFENEVRTRVFDPGTGQLLADEKTNVPTSDALNLYDGTVALVRDTGVYGATSPIKGQRLRLDYSPTFGDLTLNNVTLDYRHYVMPVRPVTLAGRVMHIARYGGSSEDERLMPLFLGYPTLVRGYDVNSFEASECTITPDGTCPEFDRLLGSRMMVVNAEVRAPLAGLFNRRLDYGPIPVELFAFFDSGVAWTRDVRPTFADGTRDWVSSAGFGARVNLFGFAIGEFNMARPLNRVGRGWLFVFNLRPGF